MARELRRPVDSAEFNRLALTPIKKRLAASWWNLRWAAHDKPGKLYFATVSGRLTPASGKVPCLYLAPNRETSFYEIYGDLVYAGKKRGREPMFSRKELEERVYLKTTAPFTVNLYDLTASRSAKQIGMDLATLYAQDVSFPREFAQRLHDHPAKFDGIQYVSRHTQAPCLVLWAAHSPALNDISLERGPGLWDLVKLDRALVPGSLRLFDTVIQVATAPA